MSHEFVIYEAGEGLATITINRPQALNALNPPLLEELLAVIGEIRRDPTLRVVILTGQGKASAAGADISVMSRYGTCDGLRFADLGHAVTCALEALPQPVLAAVNGFALGGGTELALACDMIYAAQTAVFGQPEVNLGIIPGFGGTQRLARTVGLNKARELILSGERISAEEARRIGLVAEIFAPEELLAKVREKARVIASRGPVAVAAAKRIMVRGFGLSHDAALELERQTFSALFGSFDQKEGMTAFLEKRPAKFENR